MHTRLLEYAYYSREYYSSSIVVSLLLYELVHEYIHHVYPLELHY